MNVAALLQDSPSDDSHRRRQPSSPSTGNATSQESVERGSTGSAGTGGLGGTTMGGAERGERGGGQPWPMYERPSRVQQQQQHQPSQQSQSSPWTPFAGRPGPSAPSTPIAPEGSPYPHPKENLSAPSHPWPQHIGNPYPSSAPLQPPPPPPPPPPSHSSASYDPAPSARMRSDSSTSSHPPPPPITGPGVPPPGPAYMPPPSEYPPPHLPKPPPPSGSSSASLYPTPGSISGPSRLPIPNSPVGSPYSSAPPPPPGSSTPRRTHMQINNNNPPPPSSSSSQPSHGPSSTHPSPAMASLQNPAVVGGGVWGPGVPGPPLVEREIRDRTHSAMTAERDRERDRERGQDMNNSLRDRERDWDRERDSSRRRPPPPTGPGVPPPPLAGPGTGAPPPLGPGVPPMVGPGMPDDTHKVSSAPPSLVPSRTHSRSQTAKEDILDHPKDIERAPPPRISDRDLPPPPSASGRTPEYSPREYPSYRREASDLVGPGPSSRREREDYIGPGSNPARLPPPPVSAEYRAPPHDYRREQLPHQEYRREAEYKPPLDYRRDPLPPHHHPPPPPPPPPPGGYRREAAPPNDYRREPPPPSEYRRDIPPGGDYRREHNPPLNDYRDYRRDPPQDDYRREPPQGDYRREPPPHDYRGGAEYRDLRREGLPPPGPGHSPDIYRHEAPDYRREREPPPEYTRRDSSEHRRERDFRERERERYERDIQRERDQIRERERELDARRGDQGPGPGVPPDYRHEPPQPGTTQQQQQQQQQQPPPPPPPGHHPGPDYRSNLPPHPDAGYRADHRPPHDEYRRDPVPSSEYPPSRREHIPHAPLPGGQDYRRDEYGRPPPPQPHAPSGPPPPPTHPQDYRGPPPPPGPPGSEYRRDIPPNPPGPPQEYRRDMPPPPPGQDYRGPSGSLPPPHMDYGRQGPPLPGQEYRGREAGELIQGPNSRDYSRHLDREREMRESREYGRAPATDYMGRRNERESGEYMGRPPPQQPSMPPGPGMPGGTGPSNTEMFVVKHSSDRERDRERERAWEREQRERDRSQYPPPPIPTTGGTGGQPPPPPSAASVPPASHPHHPHSHSHVKQNVHHHHSHHHHPRVIHQHPPPHHVHNVHPMSSAPVPGGGGPSGSLTSGTGGGGPSPGTMSPSSQGVGPPPSQRQLQGQFPTRFLMAQPGSRVGSPAPGSGPVPGIVGPGGGGNTVTRKEGSGAGATGKDGKKSRGGGTSGTGGTTAGVGKRERDKDDREREKEREKDVHSYPQTAPQSMPHRDREGRVLGHGYPHGPPPPGQGFEEYRSVEENMELQHHIQMQMQAAHQHHPHALLHSQSWPQPQPPHPLATPTGYCPVPQESMEAWEEEEADKEVEARFKVHLGTFVYPNTPFPYFFDVGEWVGVRDKEQPDKQTAQVNEQGNDGDDNGGNKEKEKEKEKEEDNKDSASKEREGEGQVAMKSDESEELLDVETSATIIIPSGYIPVEKPAKPHIWGGGVIGRPIPPHRQLVQPQTQDKSSSPVRPKKRRIYTDDSDLFLCALHSGWLTWSAATCARDKGKDMKIEVRIIRCAGAGAGSVFAVGAGAFAGKYAPAVNSVITNNNAMRKKNGNASSQLVRKEEVVGRFIGGWGEKCFVKDSSLDAEDETEDDEENDGRGLVSAGWGSGHDGSAIEVINAEFVERGAARNAPGLGRRNRAQRLAEYNERRMAVLGLQRPHLTSRLAGRKRRRGWDPYPPTRRLPNATVLDAVPELDEDGMDEVDLRASTDPESQEEAGLTTVRTVVFSTTASDTRLGYKYVPSLLKEILFPMPSALPIDRPPPRKRRRISMITDDIDMDGDPVESLDAPSSNKPRPVILETEKESYLLSLSQGVDPLTDHRKYDISLIMEGEVEEEREDEVVLIVADRNSPHLHIEQEPTPTLNGSAPSEPHPKTSNESEPGANSETSSSKMATAPQTPALNTNTLTGGASSNAASPIPSPQSDEDASMPVDDPAAPSKSQTLPSKDDVKPSSNEAVGAPVNAEHSINIGNPSKQPRSPKPLSKHLLAQVLQRDLGADMVNFTEEGVTIADGTGDDSMSAEWLLPIKSWKWATRKFTRV